MDFLFASWVEYEEKMYFYLRDGLLPMKYSLTNNKIELAPEFDFAKEVVWDYIDRYHRWNELIIALPESADNVVVWDIKRQLRKDIPIVANSNKWGNYAFSTIFRDKLYIFPRTSKDLPNKIICVDFLNGVVQEEIICKEINTAFSHGFMKGNEAWLISEDGSTLCRFNFAEMKYKLMNLLEKGSRIVDTHVKEDCVYFLRINGDVILYDVRNNNTSIIVEGNGNEKSKIIVGEKRMVILPDVSGDIEFIDIKDGSREIYKNYPSDFAYLYPGGKFHYKIDKNNRTYFAMASANYVLVYDGKQDRIDWNKPIAPPKEEIVSYVFKYKDVFFQEGNILLKDYLKGLIEANN